MVRRAWTFVDGLSIHARVATPGAGTQGRAIAALPVVLVHGYVVSSRYMVPFARELAARHGGYHVFAPDLPGSGKSTKPARVLTLGELSDVLAQWMEAMGIPEAAVIAQSLGCPIGVHLARRYPARVKRLVLIGPAVDPGGRTALKQAKRLLINAWREPFSLRPIVFRDLMDSGLRRPLQVGMLALQDRLEECLPQVHVPTLVVRGARDQIAPQRWAEEAVRLLPHARLTVIPGASHAANYSAPGYLAAVVDEFLRPQSTKCTDVFASAL